MSTQDEITHPALEDAVRSLVDWVDEQETQMAKAAAAKWAMALLQEVTNQISTQRIQAVRVLWEEGWSLKDISEALGISRARVHQIIEK